LGFEKFGKSGYVSQAKITQFLSYLEKGEIVATKCKNCGETFFPPRADCLRCRKSDMEWVPLDNHAELITFTEVNFAPPAFQKETPYLLGVAEFENGMRVFAPISREVNRRDLKPGLKLELKPVHAGEGIYYLLEIDRLG
jgi:uncharacterized OB-fold protein